MRQAQPLMADVWATTLLRKASCAMPRSRIRALGHGGAIVAPQATVSKRRPRGLQATAVAIAILHLFIF